MGGVPRRRLPRRPARRRSPPGHAGGEHLRERAALHDRPGDEQAHDGRVGVGADPRPRDAALPRAAVHRGRGPDRLDLVLPVLLRPPLGEAPATGPRASSTEPPSHYFRRQVFGTFMEDPVGLRERHHIGIDNIMWASDYPHSETTWPNSKALTDEWFTPLGEDDKRKVLWENAAKLYRPRSDRRRPHGRQRTRARLVGVGRRPRDRTAERVGRPRCRPSTATTCPRLVDDTVGLRREDGRRPSGLSVTIGKRKEEFTPNPVPYSEMPRGRVRPGRPRSSTWTAPASSVRSASRRSRASAARSSGRRRTRTSRCSACEAYNDWMIDEWCGTAPGRFIPLDHHPAVGPGGRGGRDRALRGEGRDRVRVLGEPRAARAARPSTTRSRYWDPVMAAAQDTADGRVHARRVVVDHADDLVRRARRSPTSPSVRSAPRARCWRGCSATSSSACRA